jgi:hypothetical protein
MNEIKTFKRLLSNGPLTGMPKRPEDQVLILASPAPASGRTKPIGPT